MRSAAPGTRDSAGGRLRPLLGAVGLGALALGAGSLASCSGEVPASPAPPAPVHPLRADERVDVLFYECERNHPYLRDTSDLLPILMEKLVSGHKEPLRRAKEELATMGPRAAEELERFVQRHFGDGLGGPFLQNALDVLGGMEGPVSHRALLRALEHPTSEVRHRALRGLADRPGTPDTYERLRLHLSVEATELQPLVARAMHRADPVRAEREFLSWMSAGAMDGIWRYLTPLVAASSDPEVLESASRIASEAPLAVRGTLLAMAHRAGVADADRGLEEMASHPEPPIRTLAAAALGQLGDRQRLAEIVRNDPDAQVRSAAAGELVALGDDPATREVLTAAMGDGSPGVRAVALDALLAWGDAAALDRVLSDLRSPSPQVLRGALDALRAPMRARPELATAAFERLRERYDRLAGRSFPSRKLTLQLIGQVPTRASVDILLAEAARLAGETIDGLRAHHWCLLQAANTGPAGQERLVELLAEETDPVRVLDFLWAIATERNELARATLLGRLARPEADPYEVLYVADVLTELGPARRVAPVLKQAVLRVSVPEVRLALQCLLWRWY